MERWVDCRENIKIFYQKYSNYIFPLMKFLLSLFSLCVTAQMFHYNAAVNRLSVLMVVSVVQAFVPLPVLFFSASVLIMLNLWKVSLELMAVFMMMFLIYYFTFVRIDNKYAFVVILTPALFFLKLEYFMPVILGITAGVGGVFPAAGGIIIYFFSIYTENSAALLSSSQKAAAAAGVQKMVSLMTADRKFLVMLAAFCLSTLVSALLYRMFHENAWLFSIVIGNVVLALMLLSGRLLFELNYAIWRVFIEAILAAGLAMVIQFFKGIGDMSRIEKVSFEDDEYIYYVKAVPKIKVSQMERSVTDINKGKDSDEGQ